MTEEQNCFLAEKLIKRLESVGMRTSYRELHDIFLSKTTNTRPIGMVFRRWKNRSGGGGGSSSPLNNNRAMMLGSSPSNNICITNEFEWSTDFLQCLSIKCREYEFDLKVPSTKGTSSTADVDNNDMMSRASVVNKLQSFLPRPNVETAVANQGSFSDFVSYIMDNLSLGYDGVQSSPLMKCMDSSLGISTESTSKKENARQERTDFLSNRILCSLVEQSMGLIFLRRLTTSNNTNNKDRGAVGSGFALMRKTDGSWSAPCFLSILGSKDEFTECAENMSALFDDVKMIIIHKKDLVNALIGGNAVKFSVRKEERAHVLVRDATVIGLQDGRFQLATDFFLTVKVNDVQNQGAYLMTSSEYLSPEQITAFDILTGEIDVPFVICILLNKKSST